MKIKSQWLGLAFAGASMYFGTISSYTNPLPSGSANVLLASKLDRGRYLATVGVCEACHTPPEVPDVAPSNGTPQYLSELTLRSNPDWFQYLDNSKQYAGGVPFAIRISGSLNGTVVTPNITQDVATGIGRWTIPDIKRALRTGVRPDGTVLFTFAPHTFFPHLAEDDLDALATYIKALPPVRNVVPPRSIPFNPTPLPVVPRLSRAPTGRSLNTAKYLMDSIVGCKECHSYRDKSGVFHEFVGGDPVDPFNGTFRLGPDLPLRSSEKGLSAFPYPGYAVLYAGNLTRYGLGGDLSWISSRRLVGSIRGGLSSEKDTANRPKPLSHVMMWQFYASMSDDDAFAIADYLKTLRYEKHEVKNRLILFGDDWESAFIQAFGESPSASDRILFGK